MQMGDAMTINWYDGPMKKRPEQKWVRIPENVYRFLLGDGRLAGKWFGDNHPVHNGPYWWRHFLRRK